MEQLEKRSSDQKKEGIAFKEALKNYSPAEKKNAGDNLFPEEDEDNDFFDDDEDYAAAI